MIGELDCYEAIRMRDMLYDLWRTHPDAWAVMGADNGWSMPSRAWWKRLPIVRHVCYALHCRRLGWHVVIFDGGIPSEWARDIWVAWGLLHGLRVSR